MPRLDIDVVGDDERDGDELPNAPLAPAPVAVIQIASFDPAPGSLSGVQLIRGAMAVQRERGCSRGLEGSR
jgi:hypothetical protein